MLEFGKQKSLIFSKLCRLHAGNGMGFINLWAKFLWLHWGARHQPWLSLSSVTRARTSASLERRVLRRRFGTLSIGNFGKQRCLSMTHFDSEMQNCSLLPQDVVFVLLIVSGATDFKRRQEKQAFCYSSGASIACANVHSQREAVSAVWESNRYHYCNTLVKVENYYTTVQLLHFFLSWAFRRAWRGFVVP